MGQDPEPSSISDNTNTKLTTHKPQQPCSNRQAVNFDCHGPLCARKPCEAGFGLYKGDQQPSSYLKYVLVIRQGWHSRYTRVKKVDSIIAERIDCGKRNRKTLDTNGGIMSKQISKRVYSNRNTGLTKENDPSRMEVA